MLANTAINATIIELRTVSGWIYFASSLSSILGFLLMPGISRPDLIRFSACCAGLNPAISTHIKPSSIANPIHARQLIKTLIGS